MVKYSPTIELVSCIIICLCGYSSGQRCFRNDGFYYIRLICDNISVIDFQNLHSEPKYESLYFKHSNVSVIPTNVFTKLSSLITIQMRNSGIQVIEGGAFLGLSELKSIDLSENRITTISRGVFNSLVSLKTLNLSENLINNIENSSFQGSNNIQHLDVSFNNLENIPESLLQPVNSLEYLHISNNLLKSVYLCYNFPHLADINLKNNHMKEFLACPTGTIPDLTGLIRLDLSNNNFSSFPSNTFETCRNLKILDISGNKLNEIESATFTGLTSLNWLNSRGNNITTLDINSFVECSNITYLDLSNNTINSIPLGLFQKNPHLEYLNISENNLEFFHSGVFNTLNELSGLYISQNNIEYLETHIFFPLKNLTVLDISHNNMKNFKIYNMGQSCPHLISIDINGNSFSCEELELLFLLYKNLIVKGFTVDKKNIEGIACSDSNYSVEINDHKNDINESIDNNRGVDDFFNKDFENTKFFKFFKNFEFPSKNADMKNDNGVPDMLNSWSKLLNDTSLDLHNRTEEFMEYIRSTSEMINSKKGNDELITKYLKSIFYEIRFFIITIMLIALTVFGVKFYRYSNLSKVFFKRNSDKNQSHDLLILSS